MLSPTRNTMGIPTYTRVQNGQYFQVGRMDGSGAAETHGRNPTNGERDVQTQSD